MTLRRLDPLWWFLGAGLAIFLVAAIVDPDGSDDASTISVDRDALQAYLSAGGGSVIEGRAGRGIESIDDLTPRQQTQLVAAYIEEEALYREATSWGLDDGDAAIRRRLGQSLRFALRPEPRADPGDAALRKYFEANRNDYEQSPRLTFEHVYFDGSRGLDVARTRAAALDPGDDWQAKGDRFAYQRTYVRARREQVAAQLGDAFADAVFAMEAGPQWQGPIVSDLGVHRVRILDRETSGPATFDTNRAAVLDDWRRAQQARELDRRITRVVAGYEARVDPALTAQDR